MKLSNFQRLDPEEQKQVVIKELPELLKKYKGRKVTKDELSESQLFDMALFTGLDFYTDPFVKANTKVNITEARRIYDDKYSKTPGATFTAYLVWSLIEAMKKIPRYQ